MQVFGLHFFFISYLDTVQHSKLRHMEQTLESVEFGVLQGVDTQVNVGKEWQVFDVLKLSDFSDSVHAHVQKLETLNAFKALQPLDLVLREVESSQDWEGLQVLYDSDLIGHQVQLFEPHVVQVLNSLNVVAS